jgi:hypothetical protein
MRNRESRKVRSSGLFAGFVRRSNPDSLFAKHRQAGPKADAIQSAERITHKLSPFPDSAIHSHGASADACRRPVLSSRARASASRASIAAFDHGHSGGSAGGGPTPAAHCSARSGMAAAMITARFAEIA